jgi:hypothetical protein
VVPADCYIRIRLQNWYIDGIDAPGVISLGLRGVVNDIDADRITAGINSANSPFVDSVVYIGEVQVNAYVGFADTILGDGDVLEFQLNGAAVRILRNGTPLAVDFVDNATNFGNYAVLDDGHYPVAPGVAFIDWSQTMAGNTERRFDDFALGVIDQEPSTVMLMGQVMA